MPSVILTFHKVLLLCARFFWLVLGLTFTTRLLESCLSVPGPHARHEPLSAFLGLGALILGMILGAANNAALLGLLREPDHASWTFMWASVRAHTGVLFWLQFRIILITLGLMIPFGLLILCLRWVPFVGFALGFIYLVLMKYALAYPLAVDQQLSVSQALERSWEMTRGHFWYVLRCYLLMALVHFTLNQLFTTPWLDAHTPWSLSFFIKHIADGFFNSLWILLGWQMYLEIKDADGTSTVGQPEVS